MQFNAAAFNAHLNGIGQKFLWRKASHCPCINPHSGASKPTCPLCFGKGVFWAAPVPAMAGMAGQKVTLQWAQYGRHEEGDAVLTVPNDSPMYDMSQFDRVTMLNSTDRFSLVKTRAMPGENLLEPIEHVSRVFWLDGSSNIVEGGIPVIAADGAPTWATNAPPDGQAYTIEGTKFSDYWCFGPFPSDRNAHSGMRLPKRVILRRMDLFKR